MTGQTSSTYPRGPFESSQEATAGSLWQALGRGDMRSANEADLATTLSGIHLGAWDRRIVEWLAGYEPSTVAVVCGWIWRARGQAAGDAARLAEIRGIFELFDWETDDRQYALEQVEDIALRSQP